MSVTEQQISQFIRETVQEPAQRLGLTLGELEGDFDLVGSGVLDSMRFVELLGAIEQRFNVQIELDGVDIETVTRVGGLIGVVLAASRNG